MPRVLIAKSVNITPPDTYAAEEIWPGGNGFIVCDFQAGQGVMALQVQSVTGTWIDSDMVFDAASGIKAFTLMPTMRIRLNVTGDDGGTQVLATVSVDQRRHFYAS